MPRSTVVRLATLLVALAWLLPAHPAQAGAWSTWIKMVTTNDILATRDTVWMATGEAGIVRYLRGPGTFESITRQPGGLASNTVTALAFDRGRRLWAGTAGKGASRLNAAGTQWDLVNTFDGLPSDSVTVMRVDGDTLWIGTTRGIALWNGHVIAGSVPDIGTPSPFRSNWVTGVVVHGDTLFVATTDGLWQARLSQNLATWSEVDAGIATKAIDGLATDGVRPWALAGGKVWAWSPADGSWSAVTDVFGHADKLRDDFGVLLAVSPNGLYRWGGTSWSTVAAAWGSGSGSEFTEFGADPDGKLFETHAQAILEQTGATWITRKPPAPIDNSLHNVLHDGTRTWVLTDAGVSRWDGSQWRNFPGSCCGAAQDTSYYGPLYGFALQQDRAGRIWSAHWESGVDRVDPSTNPMHVDHIFVNPAPKEDSLSRHSDGWSSTVDTSGYVYLGGDTPDRGALEPMGIDVYDPNGNRVITWKTTNANLPGNQVRALAVDKKGTIWAGIANAGVSWALLDDVDSDHNAANGNDHLHLPHFTPIASLATADIFGVVAHGDSMWVLTTSNLQRFRTSSRLLSSTYEIPAGPAPRGAVHPLEVAPDGTAWVGSVDGVRRYLPGGGFEDYNTSNSPIADNEVRAISVEKATGAVWIATASGINRFDPHYKAPAPPAISRLQLKAWPNPASLTAMGTQVRLTANAVSLAGEVVDLGGRVLRRFSGVASGGVVWDGRDGDGTLVHPGVYFVHARGGDHDAMVRVVVLR